jgi:CubicO group peptidase (beta-lactamase class C family)
MRSRLLLLPVLAIISMHYGSGENRHVSLTNLNDFERLARLEKRLDGLRQELKIPALSAVLVKDQKVIWAKGFGFADLEKKVPATEHTSYHLASLTKTFASTILMQLVQEGKIKLDDPVSKYGITLESEGVIRVRHLFSHTSEGNPGERYRYNGNRFAELDKVVQKATGKGFAELLIANILDPLELNETAPNVPPLVKTKSPAGADPNLEAEVKAAMMKFVATLSAGDVDQLERFLTPNHNSYRGDGALLTGFADMTQLRDAFRSGYKVNVQVRNLEAAVYGSSALTTCLINEMVTPPGGSTRTEDTMRASYNWLKENGVWKLFHTHVSPLKTSEITEKHQQRFDAVLKNLATPYVLDNKHNITVGKYPPRFSTSAGLISSVLDMAKYDIAIDQHRFLTKETQELAFTPAISTKGEKLPYGLGWFTQNYKGERLIWHYGYWTCNSSLILKVPGRNLTFIAMANTDNLSRPTDLGAGDVMSSPVGLAFLKTFIFPEIFKEELPEINWQLPVADLQEQLRQTMSKSYGDVYRKELMVQARIYPSVGNAGESSRLFKAYSTLYSKGLPDDLVKKPVIAQLDRVTDNADKTVEFNLSQAQRLRVFAIGEGGTEAMFDYGWIESAETGKAVWEMKAQETRHAGGANKNRQIDVVITLPAGRYKLRYKSDDSHSFELWNDSPPEINFWGIALYPAESVQSVSDRK